MSLEAWSNEIHLKSQEIFRFKCFDKITLIMTEGESEIFGTEFPKDNQVSFPKNFEGSLITFFGCSFRYKGLNFHYIILKFEEDYFCSNIYLNIHESLENKRNNYLMKSSGPRIMICGKQNTGKKNLSQLLVNYRLRSFNEIIFIDTNVNNNHICIPGSLAALVVTQPYDIMDGWHIDDEPLIFNFGYTNPLEDLELYKLQLTSMSHLVNDKMRNNPNLNKSGLILNLSSFESEDFLPQSREERATFILETVQLFQINYVIIINDGFLEKLVKENVNSSIKVISIPQSSESFRRDEISLLEAYKMKLSGYFKGQGIYKLQLKVFLIESKTVFIYKINSEDKNTAKRLENPILLNINRFFVNSFLAVSQATKVEDIAKLPVYGYVMVTEVSENLDYFKILTPSGKQLLSKYLLFTDFKMFF